MSSNGRSKVVFVVDRVSTISRRVCRPVSLRLVIENIYVLASELVLLGILPFRTCSSTSPHVISFADVPSMLHHSFPHLPGRRPLLPLAGHVLAPIGSPPDNLVKARIRHVMLNHMFGHDEESEWNKFTGQYEYWSEQLVSMKLVYELVDQRSTSGRPPSPT